MAKRFLSALLAVLMVISLIPVAAFATEGEDVTPPATEDKASWSAWPTAAPSEGDSSYEFTAASGETPAIIKLLKNVQPTAGLTISNGKYVLDLNGKTFTKFKATSGTTPGITINSGAELTIKDSSSGATGVINNDTADTTQGYLITNKGTLNIESGNILGTRGSGSAQSGRTAIQVISENSKLNISGGKIDSESYIAIKMDEANGKGGTLKITGGEINNSDKPMNQAVQIWNAADHEISGGIFGGKVVLWQYGDNGQAIKGKLKITGGTFKEDVLVETYKSYTNPDTTGPELTITGGTFKKDIGTKVVADALPEASAGNSTGVIKISGNAIVEGKLENVGKTKMEVTGGTFSTQEGLADYMAEDAFVTKTADGYTIGAAPQKPSVTITKTYFVTDAESYDKLPAEYKEENPIGEETYATFPWLVIEGSRLTAPVTYVVEKDGVAVENLPEATSAATINESYYQMWELEDLNEASADYPGKYQVKIKVGSKVVATSDPIEYKATEGPKLAVTVPESTNDYQTGLVIANEMLGEDGSYEYWLHGLSNYVSQIGEDTSKAGNYVKLNVKVESTSEFSDVDIFVSDKKNGSAIEDAIDEDGTLLWKVRNADGTFNSEIHITVSYKANGMPATKKYVISTYLVSIGTADVAIVKGDSEVGEMDEDAVLADVAPDKKDDIKTTLNAAAEGVVITESEQLFENNAIWIKGEAEDVVKNYEGDAVVFSVVVYTEVTPTGVTVDDEGNIETMTLDITPKYKVVALDEDGEEVEEAPIYEAELPRKNVETAVTVVLTDFVEAGAKNVYAIHNDKDWYKVNVDDTADEDGAIKGTFVTKGFSPFKFVKEDNAVEVTFTSDDAAVTLPVGSMILHEGATIPTPSKSGYIFSKWLWGEEEFTRLTPEILEAMVEAAETGPIQLTPVFTKSSTNYPPSGGGTTTTTTYEVKAPATVTGGAVTVSPARAAQGSTVTVTAVPSEGYEVESVTVTDADGNAIATTPAGEGRYTFTMPAGPVSVSASFKETGTPKPPVWENPYSDVKENDWYYNAVKYVTENGLMQGTGKDKFEPGTKLTRAMFAQILYNKAGKPAVTGTVNYKDFQTGQWYSDAIVWATQNNVLEGYSDGRVGVNDRITREMLAVMLWRYVGKPEAPTNVTIKGNVSSWAAEAMRWAVASGVINGDQNGNHDPRGTADRAQVAQILMNYYNK